MLVSAQASAGTPPGHLGTSARMQVAGRERACFQEADGRVDGVGARADAIAHAQPRRPEASARHGDDICAIPRSRHNPSNGGKQYLQNNQSKTRTRVGRRTTQKNNKQKCPSPALAQKYAKHVPHKCRASLSWLIGIGRVRSQICMRWSTFDRVRDEFKPFRATSGGFRAKLSFTWSTSYRIWSIAARIWPRIRRNTGRVRPIFGAQIGRNRLL